MAFPKSASEGGVLNNVRPSNLLARICGVVVIMRYLTKYRLRCLSVRLGFSIPLNVFGPGLGIAHYGTIVVNPNCRIGAFCRIHANTNLGASAGHKEAPCLGDRCYIGPGAILFGDILIANDRTIGANATVSHSCEKEHVVLAGTPAKIVKEEMPNWLEFNRVKL